MSTGQSLPDSQGDDSIWNQPAEIQHAAVKDGLPVPPTTPPLKQYGNNLNVKSPSVNVKSPSVNLKV